MTYTEFEKTVKNDKKVSGLINPYATITVEELNDFEAVVKILCFGKPEDSIIIESTKMEKVMTWLEAWFTFQALTSNN